METAYTLTRTCDCGETRILGVFDSMEAAVERLRVFSDITDPGEEYKLECFTVRDYEREHANTESTLKTRAHYRTLQQQKENNNDD